MVSQFLRNLKSEKHLTTQQIVEKSGVPLSTVSRVLSGSTDNPSFETICALVKAMGGSLDDLAGIKPAAPAPAPVEDGKKPKDDKPAFDIKTRTKWATWLIAYSFIITFLLIALLVTILVIDFTDSTRGFFWMQ